MKILISGVDGVVGGGAAVSAGFVLVLDATEEAGEASSFGECSRISGGDGEIISLDVGQGVGDDDDDETGED